MHAATPKAPASDAGRRYLLRTLQLSMQGQLNQG